jgi:6-pyruvoyltetrahydropterin/6-carboxytetrahydropterin synthase
MTTVAKQFRWEAAHRLPWHTGPCRHLHGHSYRMVVELGGEPNARGMVLDFQDLKSVLRPLVDAWDHATLVHDADAELLAILGQTDWKRAVLPCDTTSENLARYVADHLSREAADVLAAARVHTVRVKLQETETCYAVYERAV